MERREFMTAALGATLSTMVTGNATAAEAANDAPIKVGQSAPLTGPSAALGLEMKDGMDACFTAINRAGGVFGRPIELVSMDDGYEPDRALVNVQRMIGAGVFGFCGFVGTPTSLRVLPIVTGARMAFVGAFTGARDLRTPLNRYVFNVRAGYDLEAKKLIQQLTAFGNDARIALFLQDDSYGDTVQSAVEAALNERGLKGPVAISKVARNAEGAALEGAVGRAVAAFKEAGATGVAMGSVYSACTRLVEALDAEHLYPMLVSVSFVGTSNLLNGGAGARRIGVAEVMPAPMFPTTKVTQDFAKAMHDCGKPKLTYGAIEGYIAARTFVAGLHRCGPNPTRERFVAALESPLDLGGFELDFSAHNHNGSRFVEMVQVTESLAGNGNQIVR